MCPDCILVSHAKNPKGFMSMVEETCDSVSFISGHGKLICSLFCCIVVNQKYNKYSDVITNALKKIMSFEMMKTSLM